MQTQNIQPTCRQVREPERVSEPTPWLKKKTKLFQFRTKNWSRGGLVEVLASFAKRWRGRSGEPIKDLPHSLSSPCLIHAFRH